MYMLNLLIVTIISLVFCDENITTTSTTTTASTTIEVTSSTQSNNVTQLTTTTQVPSTTTASTIKPQENATKPDQSIKGPSNRARQLNTTSYTCNCDRTLRCDINCCCDMDCSASILPAFKCLQDMMIDDYYHGEGLERCEIDNGLFCITMDNLGSPDYYLKMPSHAEYSTYQWPQQSTDGHRDDDLEPRIKEVQAHNFYKYGDAIMAYDMRAAKLDTIKIPAAIIDSLCHLMEPVQFLKPKTSKCLKTINELRTYNSNLLHQLISSQLFYRPPQMTLRDTLGNITIQVCHRSIGNCSEIFVNDTEAGAIEFDDIYRDIRMDFVINGTSISSATVTFIMDDEIIDDQLGEEMTSRVIQTIIVQFKNVSDQAAKGIRMNSRGYNDEEYLLMSTLRPLNESATVPEMILDYFQNDTMPEDFYIKLPETRNGRCVLNELMHDEIRFNENSKTVCHIELVKDEKSNSTPCQQYQREIIHFLFHPMNLTSNYSLDTFKSNVFVSKFWTPRYDINSWARVNLKNIPAWNPDMHENEKFLICDNIAQSAEYKIYSFKVRSSGTRKYENVIERVEIEFSNFADLKIPIDNENPVKVDLEIRVQFMNVNMKITQNNACTMSIRIFLIPISFVVSHLL